MADGVALSISQFGDALGLFGRACPGAHVERADGVDYVFSGLPIAFFNVAILTGRPISAATLASQARQAMAWASDKGAPWLLVVTHEALDSGVDAAAVLDGCGLVAMIPLTGMVAQRVSPAARVPGGLRLEVPHDDAGCAAVLDVNSAAYGMDLDPSKPSLGTGTFWTGHVPVLGRAGGTPVTSAAVLMTRGHRYVALVATAPAFQRRGFAEAAMRHALTVANERFGERPTFLHATDAGRPIYARMGYETVATHLCFIDKRLLAGH